MVPCLGKIYLTKRKRAMYEDGCELIEDKLDIMTLIDTIYKAKHEESKKEKADAPRSPPEQNVSRR